MVHSTWCALHNRGGKESNITDKKYCCGQVKYEIFKINNCEKELILAVNWKLCTFAIVILKQLTKVKKGNNYKEKEMIKNKITKKNRKEWDG